MLPPKLILNQKQKDKNPLKGGRKGNENER
jgi:hypothetical protein